MNELIMNGETMNIIESISSELLNHDIKIDWNSMEGKLKQIDPLKFQFIIEKSKSTLTQNISACTLFFLHGDHIWYTASKRRTRTELKHLEFLECCTELGQQYLRRKYPKVFISPKVLPSYPKQINVIKSDWDKI